MTSRFQRLIDSISVFALLTALIPWAVNAQITAQDLSTAVKIKALQHPYLFFTDQDKPALLKRIQTEKECKTIMAGLLAEGRRYLSVPIMGSVPPSPKHPRFSAAVDEASAYTTEIREGAVTLAFLYQMTGETKYAKKAIEFAMALSDLDEWVNPAHKFDIIYPRVWPRGVPDDRVVFSYDIVAAGTSIALATVYDWVYPVLTKPERDKIRNGLLEKAITRVRGNYDFFWWSSAHRCNWSAICYSGLGISAMSLLKENPQVLDVVAEAYNGINLTLDQIGEDGGWQEGRGYYSYMMWVSIRYMDALKRMSGGAYNMFDHPRIKNHPFDFMLYGTTANFEDSEAASVGPTNMINKLTAETGSTTGAWYREKFLDEGSTPFDILWP
ncbi:MAG TPA: DUF4962 domain-containing protein, partial [Bacteroidota bacterium]|nr:DUF4962 domain-containing protein [Bacteroidota bacterium]